jgi:hypothetical protein
MDILTKDRYAPFGQSAAVLQKGLGLRVRQANNRGWFTRPTSWLPPASQRCRGNPSKRSAHPRPGTTLEAADSLQVVVVEREEAVKAYEIKILSQFGLDLRDDHIARRNDLADFHQCR